MNKQQPRQSPASNGEAVHGARAEEITPSVAGVRRKNNTAPERRSTRRRGGGLTPGCSTGPAAFNVAGGRNSIDLGPKDAPTAPAAFHVAGGRNSIDFGPRDLLRGRSLCSKESTSTCSLPIWTTRDRPRISHLLNCQVPHELLLQRQQGIDHGSRIYSMVRYLMSYCSKGNGT